MFKGHLTRLCLCVRRVAEKLIMTEIRLRLCSYFCVNPKYTVVVSLQTDDGGKKGVLVEVSRHLAAKMVVEGSALLGTPAQVAAFQESQEAAYKAAQEAATLARVEVTMVSSDDLKKLTDDMKKLKSGGKLTKE